MLIQLIECHQHGTFHRLHCWTWSAFGVWGDFGITIGGFAVAVGVPLSITFDESFHADAVVRDDGLVAEAKVTHWTQAKNNHG